MTSEEKRQRQLDKLRKRIKESDDISEEDRELLMEFSDTLYLLKSKYGVHRHEKLLRHVTIIAEDVGDLGKALSDKEKAEDIVRWINRRYDSEETNKDYRVALRIFGKRLSSSSEVPESLDWIPATTSNSHDPTPDPTEMLDWEEDIEPMIEGTRNSRDAAFIAVAWDSGARAGELLNLKVGDVKDHRHGIQITVKGKTGRRSMILIPSVPYLQRWLSDHPNREDRDAPLWSKLSEPTGVTYQAMRDRVQKAAKKAGVKKPVNFTNFRKSCASYLVNRGMNQARLEERMGWKRGSDIASRYVSVFAEKAETEFAKIHGLDVEEDESKEISPIECPRCSQETPRTEEFCVWCGQAVDPGANKSIKEEERELRSAVMRLVKEDPSLIEEVERAHDLMAIVEDNPDILEDTQRFMTALND